MKALVRNEGETITEDMKIQGIDWSDGSPLIYKDFRLVLDYVPPEETE